MTAAMATHTHYLLINLYFPSNEKILSNTSAEANSIACFTKKNY